MTVAKRLLLLMGVVCCCAGMAMAQFPPTSIFQLDGEVQPNSNYPQCTYVVKGSNPVTTITTTCDSWALLNGSGTVGQFTGGAGDHWLVRDFAAAGQGGFAFTGGSKDILNPAGGWSYSSNPTPDKDTLENVYAAAYAGGTQKDLMLVFGAERNSVLGDANIGIWFFQQDVHPDPSSNNFIGNHVNNDVFLVSSFTGGGVTPTISIYIWDTTCSGAAQPYVSNNPPASPDKVCAGKNVRYVTSKSALCSVVGSAGGAVTSVSSASACAVTNQFPITLPWPSVVKGGGTTIPTQTFFTGGIDLTDIFKNVLGVPTLPCFASYLMDTRTSQSLTATLKDFLGGKFPLCGVTIAKACQCDTILNNGIPVGNNTTSSYEYQVSGSVQNVGFGDLSNVTVTDKGLTFNCATLAAGATKAWGAGAGAGGCTPAAGNPACVGVANGNCLISTLRPEANTATVTGNSPTGTPVSAITIGDDGIAGHTTACPAAAPACNPNPGVTPSKCCQVVVNSDATLKVNFDGRVTNSGNEALTSLSVADAVMTGLVTGSYGGALTLSLFASDGTPKSGCTSSCTLLPGDYVTFTGSYTPTSADLTTNLGSATFRDRIKVTATRPDTGGPLVNDQTTATCTISIGAACPAP